MAVPLLQTTWWNESLGVLSLQFRARIAMRRSIRKPHGGWNYLLSWDSTYFDRRSGRRIEEDYSGARPTNLYYINCTREPIPSENSKELQCHHRVCLDWCCSWPTIPSYPTIPAYILVRQWLRTFPRKDNKGLTYNIPISCLPLTTKQKPIIVDISNSLSLFNHNEPPTKN